MGGRSDDGIMSLRPGYQEGDQVKEPSYFDKSGLGILLKGIGDEARKAGAGIYDLGAAPINLASRFFLGENPGLSGAKFFGLGKEEGVDPEISYLLGIPTKAKTSEMFGGMGTAEASETDAGTDTDKKTDKKTTVTAQDGATQKLSDNDLKTMYEDLLPLFKSELSADDDELKRQKFLELAKFGANLLAQPGGDLVGAVGRAAAKPIEGVGKVLQRDADIDREAKILALKTAIDRTTPGATGKLVQDLRALKFSDDEIMKYLDAQKPGAGYREQVKAGNIETLKEDLTNDFKIKKNAGVAARTMYESILEGVDETQYSELPSDKDDRKDGEYYVSPNGQVGRYDAKTGTLIKPGEKGFTGSKKKKS